METGQVMGMSLSRIPSFHKQRPTQPSLCSHADSHNIFQQVTQAVLTKPDQSNIPFKRKKFIMDLLSGLYYSYHNVN